ncbi:MAG: DNA mismatch repair protein MutS [Lentisphaeria bacterium]
MAKSSGKLTPAMRQYRELKKEVPDDSILLFRMGDFYELFFDDAKIAAPLMDVVLTQRNGVPMCGVPYHALQAYVSPLINKGRKVAIAEQIEDPKQAKGIVKRAITQVITPGTVLDQTVLQAGRSNFLVAVCSEKKKLGLALLDISTADFRLSELDSMQALENELHRLQPAECLLPQGLYEKWQADDCLPDAPGRMVWTPIEDWLFDLDIARENLCRHFGVASLDGFGCQGLSPSISSAGAVFNYAQDNLRQNADHITSLQVYSHDSYMVLDRISQRNLELVEPIFANSTASTLLNVLDHTVTPMGGRMLREWILRPLRSSTEIEKRLDAVQELVSDPLLLSELQEALDSVRDLERTIVRLNIGSANAKDLVVLRQGLEAVPGIRVLLENSEAAMIHDLCGKMCELPEITDHIKRAITEEPASTLTEGGIIREGYNDELDELLKAARDGKSWIVDLQSKEQERTGIKSLKVRYNKVFGYYIEVTKANLDMVPEDYIRKQTLVNAERFITPELKELENKVTGAEEKSKALEYELFQNLRAEVVDCTDRIQTTARALAAIDAVASLAKTAVENDYRRPAISDDNVLNIEEGRHPVLDNTLQDERFVPNDTYMDTESAQIALITGPNMAGKSTYIRQVALLVLLAQMGSFVPAKSARVGVVDRIFTRVGAADDIARGQSTFMVEMVETANILNNATDKSLIILDEIGRGTSTYDGLSLAWAVTEYLHNEPEVKARTLFATHYHELTQLATTMEGIQNFNVAVREWGDKVIFLHKILPGGTDKSYGIHVARLAGLPRAVIKRANEVLTNLEGNAVNDSGKPKIARSRKAPKEVKEESSQLTLFDW